MEYSILLDLYLSAKEVNFSKDKEDVQADCLLQKQDILDLLANEDAHLISEYAENLLNGLQEKNENKLIEALHFGILVGMEIKEMLLKYEGAL